MEGKYVRLEPLSIEKHGDALFEIVSQEKQRLDYLPEYPPKDRDQFQVMIRFKSPFFEHLAMANYGRIKPRSFIFYHY